MIRTIKDGMSSAAAAFVETWRRNRAIRSGRLDGSGLAPALLKGAQASPGVSLTGAQSPGSVNPTASRYNGIAIGYGKPPPRSYETYREIINDPTAYLAFSALYAPIFAGSWTIETDDASDPFQDEAAKFISSAILPLRSSLIRDYARASVYGFSAFERVFETVEFKGEIRVKYNRVKWLLPDISTICVYQDSGDFAGIEQVVAGRDTIFLDDARAFVYTLDGEGSDYYGTSHCERAREAWSDAKAERQRVGVYTKRISGAIPIVMYPAGRSLGADGVERDNREIAMSIRDSLANSSGVVIENLSASSIEGDSRLADELAGRSLWKIVTLDFGSVNHTGGFNDRIRQLESKIVRAFLTTERSLLEAQTAGSRADSFTAADKSLQLSSILNNAIAESVTQNLVEPLLWFNYGRAMSGRIRIAASSIVAEAVDFNRQLASTLLQNPALAPDAWRDVDRDQLFDRAGVPKSRRIVDNGDGSIDLLVEAMRADPADEANQQTGQA